MEHERGDRSLSGATGEGGWVSIDYTNHRGDRGIRLVKPRRVWLGATEWHPGEQWLLEAFDRDRQALRNFALQDIHEWHTRQEQSATAEVRPGVYRHFKGELYHVMATLRHSETEQEMVLYRTLYGEFSLWVRPREMFESEVTGPQGERVRRFQFVSELSAVTDDG
ncbi:DUF1653 domain-containing protein [Streptomyces sp. NPDC088794]|uniref:DUF1653 domain-containing protein n=1 Tax=Streptomyces sp. NPDC088794 TaxID=3365902 RepID=UPI003800A218